MFGLFKRCRDNHEYSDWHIKPYRDDLNLWTWTETNMFELLLKGISKAEHMASVADLMNHAHTVIATLEDEYFEDHNIRDAAIDTICQILQQHKTKPE